MSFRLVDNARRPSERSTIRHASVCGCTLADGPLTRRLERNGVERVIVGRNALLRPLKKYLESIAFNRRSPSMTAHRAASRDGWVQIWVHGFRNRRICWHFSVSEWPGGMPWAQGVAGSNPAAPTTFLVPG